jgi:hypothetical protein
MPQNVRVPENNSWEVGNRGSLNWLLANPFKRRSNKGILPTIFVAGSKEY